MLRSGLGCQVHARCDRERQRFVHPPRSRSTTPRRGRDPPAGRCRPRSGRGVGAEVGEAPSSASPSEAGLPRGGPAPPRVRAPASRGWSTAWRVARARSSRQLGNRTKSGCSSARVGLQKSVSSTASAKARRAARQTKHPSNSGQGRRPIDTGAPLGREPVRGQHATKPFAACTDPALRRPLLAVLRYAARMTEGVLAVGPRRPLTGAARAVGLARRKAGGASRGHCGE